jgi:DNA-binding beta-propeller fold protein YncE
MFGGLRHRDLRGLLGLAVLIAAIAAGTAMALAADGSGATSAKPASAGGGSQAERPRPSPLRDVLAVSNNWDGTVDLVDPRTFKRLKRLNIVPDYDQRVMEIATNPVDLAFFIGIRNQIGEGHDQLADDAFTSPDGRFLYVSRPSFADVVAINMRTGKIKWRFLMDGQRSDHMAISRNGRRVLVSDSTANKVHAIDTATGRSLGSFPSGDSPHENNFSKDQRRIIHASIGRVYTPTDDPDLAASKGVEVFEIVNARTLKVIKKLNMGEELDRAGYPDMSAAVRPMTFSRDERFVYFQVSFFHGFVEYDLKHFKVRRVVPLPIADHTKDTPREDYLLDSAHHGIAMNPQGTKLCVAGTMSDYAAIVSRKTLRYKIIRLGIGAKPYWSTPSADGRYCFVSISGQDAVAVISYARERKVATFRVGDHPQRMRVGVIRRAFLR